MSELLTYDPWASVKSRNGIPADELISMLQKSIRRGEVKNALIAAYELHISSPQLSDKLWRRLLTISVEDVGFGDPNAPEVIWSLYKSRRDFAYPDGDQPILLVFAVRYPVSYTHLMSGKWGMAEKEVRPSVSAIKA